MVCFEHVLSWKPLLYCWLCNAHDRTFLYFCQFFFQNLRKSTALCSPEAKACPAYGISLYPCSKYEYLFVEKYGMTIERNFVLPIYTYFIPQMCLAVQTVSRLCARKIWIGEVLYYTSVESRIFAVSSPSTDARTGLYCCR